MPQPATLRYSRKRGLDDDWKECAFAGQESSGKSELQGKCQSKVSSDGNKSESFIGAWLYEENQNLALILS
jgi:hypothetical protein